MTNDRQINEACRAIQGHQVGRSNDEALIDILTDLMHWAECYAEDFPNCARIAAMHFEAETEARQ